MIPISSKLAMIASMEVSITLVSLLIFEDGDTSDSRFHADL